MKIEAGKFYRNGFGAVLGPIVKPKGPSSMLYPFAVRDGASWTTWDERGRYNVGTTTNYDLVEEVAAPELDGEQMDAAQIEALAQGYAVMPNPLQLIEVDATTICDTVREPSDFAEVGYEPLAGVLREAHDQAAIGKGKERHANAKPFTEQPILAIGRMCGLGYHTGQIQKKVQEAGSMHARGHNDAAIAELLGAINYSAAAILLIRETARKG